MNMMTDSDRSTLRTSLFVRLRPIRRRMAEQLERDVHHVHTLLLEWPHFAAASSTGSRATPQPQSLQTAYSRIVDKAMARIEPVLSMLIAPDDPRAFVEAYRQRVGDQSLGNFQKLLDLKVRIHALASQSACDMLGMSVYVMRYRHARHHCAAV